MNISSDRRFAWKGVFRHRSKSAARYLTLAEMGELVALQLALLEPLTPLAGGFWFGQFPLEGPSLSRWVRAVSFPKSKTPS